mmetsp:Transcript_17666/g.29596  ORF Transcript_17666/g.29596 Transcript_17666/m.29596 type:complete len:362 (+) Transcript_17666:147-1232(+)|eukprot:CAMPEP_0174987004 /NCGR_PEP_ID=MMETSP0004_2-20121128/19286_1 /TAXON_ID=420556 /ORGANISM="Ochromonas sp., Strain CCMP1393" /LENGTH=361 /DNA_ID=CAMNT_0016239975 /DNA_START=126 /DNA_END=1211 /DNA_ORIENTATION=-
MSTATGMEGKRLTIKMLLSNNITGSLIGAGGKSIKEMQTVTGAKVHVSSNSEPYPGTSDRVIVISGEFEAVSLTQTLIWELIALVSSAESAKEVQWSPQAMVGFLGQNDSVEVVGKVTIPAAAGGMILGRGGANIRTMAEESGTRVNMTGKDEALFTQERVMTISGGVGNCIKCTNLILNKLLEPEEIIPYVNRGSSYAAATGTVFGMPYGPGIGYMNGGGNVGGMHHVGPTAGVKRGYAGSTGPGAHQQQQAAMMGALQAAAGEDGGGLPMAETVITLSVPNDLMGNIFGRQGATLREIISLSGARVTVSGRDEFVEGTTNRIVTITGTPSCAQTAHLFINQRLQTPANPRRPRVAGGEV